MQQNKPLVYVFFKIVGNDVEMTEEIQQTISLLAEDYAHFFGKYHELNDIKFWLLEFIAKHLNIGAEIGIKDGKILRQQMHHGSRSTLFTKAERYYQQAIDMRKKYFLYSPRAHGKYLAAAQINLGQLFFVNNKVDSAEQIYLKVIDMCLQLVDEAPDVYEPVLAKTYRDLAIIYQDMKKGKKARAYQDQAIALAKKHPNCPDSKSAFK